MTAARAAVLIALRYGFFREHVGRGHERKNPGGSPPGFRVQSVVSGSYPEAPARVVPIRRSLVSKLTDPEHTRDIVTHRAMRLVTAAFRDVVGRVMEGWLGKLPEWRDGCTLHVRLYMSIKNAPTGNRTRFSELKARRSGH